MRDAMPAPLTIGRAIEARLRYCPSNSEVGMRMMGLVLALVMATTAWAEAPGRLTHSGRLFDAAGVPVEGSQSLTVRLYDDAAGGVLLYESVGPAQFTDGFFAVVLDGLDADRVNVPSAWVALQLNDNPELPARLPLTSVPYALLSQDALRADTATNVDGGVVNASELQINGTTIIDASGAIVSGAPNALDALNCLSGEIPLYDGLAWTCAPQRVDHEHDASEVTSGVFAIARLPIGGGSQEVAAGDHVHGLGDLTGQLRADQIPFGSGSAEVARGDHTHVVAFADLTGAATAAQLPIGVGPGQVAAGDHTHVLAALSGDLPIGRVTGDLPMSRVTGDLPMSRVTGDLPMSRVTGNLDAARLAGTIDVARIPLGTSATTVSRGDHTHTAAQISGPINAATVGGIAPSALVTKTVRAATIPAGAAQDVVHNANTPDVGVTVWSREGGVWKMAGQPSVSSLSRTGLRAYYDFDEGSGSTARDTSGNDNHATAQGATWGTGYSGSAANFAGNTGYFEAADSASLDVSGAGLTMAAWVYRTANATDDHYIVMNKENSYEMALFPGTASFQWALTTSNRSWFWVNTGYNVPLNEWVHLAVTYNGANVVSFVNGSQVQSYSYTGTVTPTNETLRIGGRGGTSGRFRIGRLDGAAIYDRPLSAAELTALMSASAPGGVEITIKDNNTVTVTNRGVNAMEARVVVHH